MTAAQPSARPYYSLVSQTLRLSDSSQQQVPLSDDVFNVGGLDGVVRTNLVLRDSLAGRAIHFTVSVTDDDVTSSSAHVMV